MKTTDDITLKESIVALQVDLTVDTSMFIVRTSKQDGIAQQSAAGTESDCKGTNCGNGKCTRTTITLAGEPCEAKVCTDRQRMPQ